MSTGRRDFARNLRGRGSAAKAREAASEAIRERSFIVIHYYYNYIIRETLQSLLVVMFIT